MWAGVGTRAGLRDEEKSRRGAGDGLHVLLIVAAEVAPQQVVKDAHDAHEGQEEDDAFPKQVAWGAAQVEKKRKMVTARLFTLPER